MAKLGEANIGGRMVPAWLLNLTSEELDSLRSRWYNNPNLLDNWYFGNPVDQRGGYVLPPGSPLWLNGEDTGKVTDKYYPCKVAQSGDWDSVTIDGVTYSVWKTFKVRGYTDNINGGSIDRWQAPGYSNQAICIMTDCIRLKSTGEYGRIIQHIPADITQYIKDKTVTISILTKNTNPLMTLTRAFNTMSGGIELNFDFLIYTTVEDDGTSILYLHQIGNNAYTDILAIKLELGTTQTLAHKENGVWVLNEIPDYGEQLRRCQRYYYQTWTGASPKTDKGYIGFNAGTNNSTPDVFRPPVTMRTTPSVTVYNPLTGNESCVSDYNSDAEIAGIVNYAGKTTEKVIMLNHTQKLTNGRKYICHLKLDAEIY